MQSRLDIILETVQRIIEQESSQPKRTPEFAPWNKSRGNKFTGPNYSDFDTPGEKVYNMGVVDTVTKLPPKEFNELEGEVGTAWSEFSPDSPNREAMRNLGRSLNVKGIVKDAANQAAQRQHQARMHGQQTAGTEQGKSVATRVPAPERYVPSNKFFTPETNPYNRPLTPEEQETQDRLRHELKSSIKSGEEDIRIGDTDDVVGPSNFELIDPSRNRFLQGLKRYFDHINTTDPDDPFNMKRGFH